MEKGSNFLGFDGVGDFIHSMFRFDDWSLNGLFAILGAITTFITGFIWDSPEAVWTLWVLMGADWLTGIVKSIRKKEFVSYKLFRMPLYFVVTSFVLAITWWMAKGSGMFFILPGLVMAGFYSVYFISLLENLGELELLPKGLISVLKSRFGLKVIVDKYMKKEGEDPIEENIDSGDEPL